MGTVWIAECGLRIYDLHLRRTNDARISLRLRNPQSAIRNPQSAIRNLSVRPQALQQAQQPQPGVQVPLAQVSQPQVQAQEQVVSLFIVLFSVSFRGRGKLTGTVAADAVDAHRQTLADTVGVALEPAVGQQGRPVRREHGVQDGTGL